LSKWGQSGAQFRRFGFADSVRSQVYGAALQERHNYARVVSHVAGLFRQLDFAVTIDALKGHEHDCPPSLHCIMSNTGNGLQAQKA
jgi:hypothetical protein